MKLDAILHIPMSEYAHGLASAHLGGLKGVQACRQRIVLFPSKEGGGVDVLVPYINQHHQSCHDSIAGDIHRGVVFVGSYSGGLLLFPAAVSWTAGHS